MTRRSIISALERNVISRLPKAVRTFYHRLRHQQTHLSYQAAVFIFILLIICFGMFVSQRQHQEEDNEESNRIWEYIQTFHDDVDNEYVRRRKIENETDMNPMNFFGHFESNWPCYWSTEPLQNGDGFKWACGLYHLKATDRDCVIYSIGSNNQWEFEVAVDALLPHCNIFTFDPTVAQPQMPSSIEDKVVFNKWGIAGSDDEQTSMFLLSSIMTKLNHSHIDLLKIDAEGYEWSAFTSLDSLQQWPSIGQMLIEIHVGEKWFVDGYVPKHDVETATGRKAILGDIFGLFEAHNLRMFHHEVNEGASWCCSEFSFIQSKWHPNTTKYE